MTNNNDKKVLNVPLLRFPEFTEEWKEHCLAEYLDFKNGLNPSANKFGSGIKFISVMDILNNNFITYDCIRTSVKITPEEQVAFAVEKGDMLFQRSSETLEDVGRANVYMDENPAVFGGFVIRGKKKTEYNPMFFRYLLASPYARKKIIPMGAGAQHFNIGQDGLSKVKLHFPILQEQQKIAALLRLIDERITTQNKIIEKYESLIQAIIYKTKTNGITKGSWQKMELSKVLHERNEKNIDGRTICSVSVSQGVVNQVEYLGRSFAAQQTNHYNVVKYGDIVYTKSPTGDFPYGIIKRSDIEEDVAVSPLYGVYTPSNDNIGVILHFYFMKPSNAFNYLHPLIQKGAKNTINITNLRFLENFVPLPISENEAYTIATTLKTIQKKIDIEKRLLQAYMIEKEYLLRQMFI